MIKDIIINLLARTLLIQQKTMNTKTTTTEDRCRRCGLAQIVREQLAEILEQRDRIYDLEQQLQSLGIRPCSKENQAVYVPILICTKMHKKNSPPQNFNI